jgi:hypothetical protein
MSDDQPEQKPNDLLIVIRAGMTTEKGVKWVGASDLHDAIVRLLDSRLAALVPGQTIDDLSDEIMALITLLPGGIPDPYSE